MSAEVTSFGEIEADTTIRNDSGDFSVTKSRRVFFVEFDNDMSSSVIVATAKTEQNGDPRVVAQVERGETANRFEITVVRVSDGGAQDDRGFWFMAIRLVLTSAPAQ